ncbi:MAG: hypothetical protein ABI359_12990 [Ginsengibacter sp.]
MSETDKSWWQTLPGIITAVAGGITAITGLILALNQSGCSKTKMATSESKSRRDSVVVYTPPSKSIEKSETPVIPATVDTVTWDRAPVHLSEHYEGRVKIEILTATIEKQDNDHKLLTLQIRATDETGFGQNLSDANFTLLVNKVPISLEQSVSIYVGAHASQQENLLFVVPEDAKEAVLKLFYGVSTQVTREIPLKF